MKRSELGWPQPGGRVRRSNEPEALGERSNDIVRRHGLVTMGTGAVDQPGDLVLPGLPATHGHLAHSSNIGSIVLRPADRSHLR
jgi:cytosine/adenosine deaminase-related metal-dependent hydrolase